VQPLAVLPMPGGRTLLAAAGYHGIVRLWDPAAGQLVSTPTGHAGSVGALTAAPLPDGRVLLVAAGADQAITVWAPMTDQIVPGQHGRLDGFT